MDPLRQVLASTNEMVLEVILYVLAINDTLGGKVPSSKEHGEKNLARKATIIDSPNHCGEIIWGGIRVVNNGGVRSSKTLGVQSTGIQSPHGCSRATGKSRPDVLMGVHEDVKAVISSSSEDLNSMLDPFLIVYAWPSGLKSLPSKHISDGIVSPTLQAREVEVCILEGKGTTVEIDVIAIEEVFENVGGQVGCAW